MKFEEIYEPISKQLSEVDAEIKNISGTLGSPPTQEIFKHFFKNPGKYLRPTLVLLTAGAINNNLSTVKYNKLIQLAVAIELIHSASLIHDDIIDGDLLRRGQKTVNNVFGRKVAILAGDALYSRAYLIFSTEMPKELQEFIAKVAEKMSLTEIDQARIEQPTKEEYLEIIKGKTAVLMSACCRLAASLIEADETTVKNLEEFGLNLGMTYQVIDDYMDGDPNALRNVTLEDAQEYASRAIASISNLEDSIYKHNLISFITFLLNFSHEKARVKA